MDQAGPPRPPRLVAEVGSRPGPAHPGQRLAQTGVEARLVIFGNGCVPAHVPDGASNVVLPENEGIPPGAQRRLAEHGTVLADAPGLYTLSLDDPAVEQTALHIYDAQNRPERTFPSHLGKTVPGKKPQEQGESLPLHRIEDSKKIDSNRRASGRVRDDVWGNKGDGKLVNCDEYPFASTYEGASTGDRRSFSARPIGADDNQEAGRRLQRTYYEQRILNGDPFYVQITGTP
ncbi:NucA/NucB deoxyribonuclease domain-containing protein [Nocardiopsis sp. CNT-189]|uniref:NucA/NucB deoxyribonuclease domain-containing protein n=1 Tax=Nocardiopsis oceanisediminis TaxID=2816862 RepID=UPI003B3A4A94